MRTNKFIPFYLALILHIIPFTYFLINKPKIPLTLRLVDPKNSLQRIDLNSFRIAEATAKKNTTKNLINTAGHPTINIAPLSGKINISEKNVAATKTSKVSTEPRFIYFSKPPYPPIARQKGFEGKIKIKVYYNNVGLITKVDIIESSDIKMLDETVRKTALSWKLATTDAGNFEKIFEFKLNN